MAGAKLIYTTIETSVVGSEYRLWTMMAVSFTSQNNIISMGRFKFESRKIFNNIFDFDYDYLGFVDL